METWHGLLFQRICYESMRPGLESLGLKVFVPCEVRLTRTGRKQSWPMVPYAFVKGDKAAEREDVLRVRGVLRYLRTTGRQYATATEDQIVRMQSAIGKLTWLSARPDMRPGDRVRVRRGALSEIDGVVREIVRGKPLVAFEMLGKEHTAVVDLDAVAVVG